MSLGLVIGVGALGGVGAVARFLLDGAVSQRLGRGFPWGTLAVNLSGAFALGILVGAGIGDDTYSLAGTGVLGAFTTFSTWMLETHRLAEEGRVRRGVLNIAVSLVLGLGLAWIGRELGGAL